MSAGLAEPQPGDPAYKVPTWKKVLGFIAATAAGTGAKNPELAGQLYEDIAHGPYNRAEEEFKKTKAGFAEQAQNVLAEANLEHLQAETDRLQRGDGKAGSLTQQESDAVDELVGSGMSRVNAIGKVKSAGQKPEKETFEESEYDEWKAAQPPGQPTDRLTFENSRSANRTETPFALWRQQHPNADVSEYFKLQPEARNAARPPEKQGHLTPGQKAAAERRYKGALADIEGEFRARQSGTYVDKRSGELLPAMTQDELKQRKQQAEDDYKDELEAGGENVTRYSYDSQAPLSASPTPAPSNRLAVAPRNAAGGSRRGSRPPAGATHTAPGSDGKLHYTNAKGEDLGPVS